ncbi:Nuclear actin-protein involved in chromatin remodeling [Cichlidogyrus casuarinus]|uniref:Nuclear actin-protein involved in chromatin remodeling n=1 Tax=Cichlidogyrus casuarinus TaxID=1844966 RepID=A0ABD2PYE6_9PLAT
MDSLAAYHQNKNSFPSGSKNALIASIGYHSSHLVPIFDNQLIPQAVRRINLGGYNCVYSLQKLLEMKYPCHAEMFNYSFAADILHRFGSFSFNYRTDSTKWKDPKYASENSQPIQLPFSKVGADEIQAAIDKKHQKVERLKEFRRRKLETELNESSEKLQKLKEINDLVTSDRHSSAITKRLKELDIETVEDIDTEMSSLSEHIDNLNEKLSAIQESKTKNSDSNSNSTTDDDPFAPEVVGPSQVGPDSTQRFKGRCKLAYEALCSQAIWLQSIRNKHARVSKQRQQRMSKLELAAEFGIRQGISSILDSSDAPQELQQDPAELSTGRGGAPMTERRRMQLEKIRAMTSELQSNRLPSSATTPKRSAKKPKNSQPKKGKKGKKPSEEPDTAAFEAEQIDNLSYQEQDEFEEVIEEDPASQSSAEEAEEVASKRKRQSSCTNIPVVRRSHFEILEEDAGTVSESERDQLAIYEAILALYDPNTVRDIASTDYQVNIEDYYTIKLETEPIRLVLLIVEINQTIQIHRDSI